MSTDKNPRRLGRGLEALLGQKQLTAPTASDRTAEEPPRHPRDEVPPSALQDIPVADIQPNQYQPRKEFKADELRELRESIEAVGLLQPVTVRKLSSGTGYELVAGERRLRAVKSLGWPKIPAIVRDYDDRNSLALALVENLQREDLNPIEEAEGYARLSGEFGLTQVELAELVGKDRSTIANLLRVLQLPAAVRRMLQIGNLTLGHARPLLALEDDKLAVSLATEAVEHGLSVRAVEERVRQDAPRSEKPQRGRPRKEDLRSAEVRYVEDSLRRRLQTDVSVLAKKNDKGELRIHFYSTEDLNRILDLLGAVE
ncbi:MAG: ParB/RepB/Spo0J family partition protein [Gemmatimonadaceae bacterium]